jgi:hypothetical protein
MSISKSKQIEDAATYLYDHGFLQIHELDQMIEVSSLEFQTVANAFGALAPDTACRSRAFDSFVILPGQALPDLSTASPLWIEASYGQAADLNPEHAGQRREFRSLPAAVRNGSYLRKLVQAVLQVLPLERFYAGRPVLRLGVHMIRLTASRDKPARASPPHPHRDGDAYTVIVPIARHNIIGGDSEVYMANRGPGGELECGALLFKEAVPVGKAMAVQDGSVFHDVSEVAVQDPRYDGYRDVILLDVNVMTAVTLDAMGWPSVDLSRFVRHPLLSG